MPRREKLTPTNLSGGRSSCICKLQRLHEPATYDAILVHKSLASIEKLLAAGDATLLKPTPTNLFLYFLFLGSAERVSQAMR